MINAAPVKQERFWKRQTSSTVTSRQHIFDVIFGIIVPILLLIFDPIVFRSQGCLGYPILGSYVIFTYLGVGAGTITLLVCLFERALSPKTLAFMGGVLLVGGFFALAVGLVLAPISVIGLFIAIGVLGFMPFLISFVYFRNAIRAIRAAKRALPKKALITFIAAGLVLVVAVPAFIQFQLTNAIRTNVQQIVAHPDASEAAVSSLVQINALCLGFCRASINTAFERELQKSVTEANRPQAALIYRRISGDNLVNYDCGSSQ